jgi:hypothetical protein
LQGRAYYLCPASHAGHVPVDAVPRLALPRKWS